MAGVSAGSFGAFRMELKFESVSPSVKTPPSVKLVASERDSWNVMNVEREGLEANTYSQGQVSGKSHSIREIRKGTNIFEYSIAIEGRTLQLSSDLRSTWSDPRLEDSYIDYDDQEQTVQRQANPCRQGKWHWSQVQKLQKKSIKRY